MSNIIGRTKLSVQKCYYILTGFVPAEFVSHRDQKSESVNYKPEDFMDEEVGYEVTNGMETNLKVYYKENVILKQERNVIIKCL